MEVYTKLVMKNRKICHEQNVPPSKQCISIEHLDLSQWADAQLHLSVSQDSSADHELLVARVGDRLSVNKRDTQSLMCRDSCLRSPKVGVKWYAARENLHESRDIKTIWDSIQCESDFRQWAWRSLRIQTAIYMVFMKAHRTIYTKGRKLNFNDCRLGRKIM
jgi:hypothetical protein